MVQEFFCSSCNGYAVVEMVKSNAIRVTPCQCQLEEDEL